MLTGLPGGDDPWRRGVAGTKAAAGALPWTSTTGWGAISTGFSSFFFPQTGIARAAWAPAGGGFWSPHPLAFGVLLPAPAPSAGFALRVGRIGMGSTQIPTKRPGNTEHGKVSFPRAPRRFLFASVLACVADGNSSFPFSPTSAFPAPLRMAPAPGNTWGEVP